MKYCSRCLTPDTRPRVVFTEGVCNACLWADKKEKIDWADRNLKLRIICETFKERARKIGNPYDVLVGVSGGKDGSYVAWKMKHEFGMNPLCVTFSPPMQTELGRTNLDNFRASGFDLIEIRPNPEVYRQLCRRMFIEQGRVKFPFVIGIQTAVAQMAIAYDIPFIMGGEEGETEYGGENKHESEDFMTVDYMRNIYHEGNDLSEYLDEFNRNDIHWWIAPPAEVFENFSYTWWSKWESWDDKLHADLAVRNCGLELSDGEVGTFTNYAQLDDALQDLHMYECFLKFGFGRATADCNLAIKAGRMSRKKAVQTIKDQDGIFPIKYLGQYCVFLRMNESEFWQVIDTHANKDILLRTSTTMRPWILKDTI